MIQERFHRGLGMLAAASILGVLADGLLRALPLGLNVLLWLAALFAVSVISARVFKLPLEGGGRWLFVPMLVFAMAVTWRDSPVLKGANLLCIFCALALVMLRGRSGDVRSLGIVQGLLGLVTACMNAVFASILLLFSDIKWHELASKERRRQTAALLRGLLLAVPLVLIFGGLFAAADAAFAALIGRLFRFDPATIGLHCLCIGVGAWLAGGFLRGSLLRDDDSLMDPTITGFFSLGGTEVGIALGALNALFLLFVCVQVPYLFGGQSHVVSTPGLTAADYARRGFFELVTVSGLVLPLLLILQGHLREDDRRSHRHFQALASMLLILTTIVMASAVQRMVLYSAGFGLTELRFYTTAFMGWLGILFLWYGLTALQFRRGFFFGAVISGFAIVGALDLISPDAIIVRTNVGRLSRHSGFDARYAASLSADAVPTVVESWPLLSESDRRLVAVRLRRRWLDSRHEDWRSWSIGRAAARRAVTQASTAIRNYSIDEPQTAPSAD